MSIFNLFGDATITVLTPTESVDLGNTYQDWTNPTETTIPGCRIEQGDSREDHDRADGAVYDWTIFTPAQTFVHASQRIRFTYGGREHIVDVADGSSRLLTDPLGILNHRMIGATERTDQTPGA